MVGDRMGAADSEGRLAILGHRAAWQGPGPGRHAAPEGQVREDRRDDPTVHRSDRRDELARDAAVISATLSQSQTAIPPAGRRGRTRRSVTLPELLWIPPFLTPTHLACLLLNAHWARI